MDNMNSDPTIQLQPVDQSPPDLMAPPDAQPTDQAPPDLMASPDAQPVDQAPPDVQPIEQSAQDLLQPSNDPFSNLSLAVPADPFFDIGQPQSADIGQPGDVSIMLQPSIGQFDVGSFSPQSNYSPPVEVPQTATPIKTVTPVQKTASTGKKIAKKHKTKSNTSRLSVSK